MASLTPQLIDSLMDTILGVSYEIQAYNNSWVQVEFTCDFAETPHHEFKQCTIAACQLHLALLRSGIGNVIELQVDDLNDNEFLDRDGFTWLFYVQLL